MKPAKSKHNVVLPVRQQSISSTGQEALLPVQLDPASEVAKDYEPMFFPNAKPTKTSSTTRASWMELAKYLASVSGYVNAAFGQARYLVVEAPWFSTLPADRAEMTSTANLSNMLKKLTADNVARDCKTFISTLGQGKSHIIRPSTKFKNGYDIVFSGLPAGFGAAGTPLSLETANRVAAPIPDSSKDPSYISMHQPETGAFNLPQGKAAMLFAQNLFKGLFTDVSVGSLSTAHERKTVMLPLDFDFNAVMKYAISEFARTEDPVKLEQLNSIPKLDPMLRAALGKYFSILVVREANGSLVRKKLQQPLGDAESYNMSPEQFTLSPVIGFSMVMHLPEQLAAFITQTTPGGRVPLVPLNTWATLWSRAMLRVPKMKAAKNADGTRDLVRMKHTPRYILSASSTASIAQRRKTLGFYTEEGRTNADNMFVANNGTLQYCPKSSELSLENAKNYESLMEESLQLSFDAGTPLNASIEGSNNAVFGLASPNYAAKIAGMKASIKKYAGSMQTYSWDYNCILTSALTDPDKLISMDLSGAARPDELSVSDYLRKPFAESMRLLFPQSIVGEGKYAQRVSKETFGHGGMSTVPMLHSSIFLNTFRLYAYLLQDKLVPSFQALVTEAAKNLDLTSMSDSMLEKFMNNGLFTDDFKVAPVLDPDGLSNAQAQVDAMRVILEKVLRDCSGSSSSNLARMCYNSGDDIVEDKRYFNPETHRLEEFKNVFGYMGGQIFYLALKHLTEVDKSKLLVININNPLPMINFQSVVKEVMPLAVIMSNYVVGSENVNKRADELAEKNKRDTSIGVEDIHVPGSKGTGPNGETGMQLFPHQVEGQQYLRGHPRFGVLDIAPGGGKTILGITDIACLVHEKLISKPLIICPNNLVKNWVEDMHKVTQGKWNMIPVTKDSYRFWGDERLTKMIKDAPINTIVVVSEGLLKLDTYPVVIGNHTEIVSGTLEFIKKFGFDYIIEDESHRLKNPKTVLHKASKQLCTASCVKFVRLATGTLISNVLTDVVGQAAMFSSQIFRTPEEYKAANSEQVGDTKVLRFRKETPKMAREQLKRHASVITFKRKEWAFMLPIPKETFIAVSMEKSEAEGGNAQQLMYDTILADTLDELKADKTIIGLLQGKRVSEDGEKDDDDDDDDDDDTAKSKSKDVGDMDDEVLEELGTLLTPHLARLEQMLTDPLGDKFGEKYFAGIQRKGWVSNKTLKVIERIRLNFQDFPWVKGDTYNLRDIVDIGTGDNKQRFVLMPPKEVPITDEDLYYAPYRSSISPDQDPRWKTEARGKVIVFCRYIRSVNTIFDALPPDLKKMAVKYHGEVKDRVANLAAFTRNPIHESKGVQILVANEQAIKEGLNLQMASRLIRVESPWAPGDLDQSAARVFRPDPSGNFTRENVYLDWILTNGSIEVSKMGRLISKMLTNTQFDEADNPLYDKINENALPPLRMGIETFKALPLLSDIEEYTNSYQNLVSVRAQEFIEMRSTKPSKMVDIEPTPMMPGWKVLDHVPYVANLDVPDVNNFGLDRLNSFLDDSSNPDTAAVLKDPNKLIGMYAHTEMGNGTIIKVMCSNVAKDDPTAPRVIRRVDVKLVGVDDVYEGDPSMIFLARNLTAETIKNFALTTPWATPTDKARSERMKERAIKKEKAQAIKDARRSEKEMETLKKLKALEKLKKTGKPPVVKVKPVVVEEPEEENNNLDLFPVVYNGFLALEATPEDTDIDMTQYGFREVGEYAFAIIPNYDSFTSVLKYINKTFTLSTATQKRLDSLHSTFVSGKGRKFAVEQTNMSKLQNFFRVTHLVSKQDKATKKYELKIYPVIENGTLTLQVDLKTNPMFRKLLGKNIAVGAKSVTFEKGSGLNVLFVSTKADIVKKYKELVKEGFVIVNADELKAETKALKISQVQS